METKTWVLDDAAAANLINQGAGVTEVAKTLGVSRQTVYKAIRKGRIPAPNARLGSTLAQQDSTPPDAACAGTAPTRG
jgi:excisionase family DNA binding protein